MGFFVSDENIPPPQKTPQRRANKGGVQLAEKGCDACSLREAWPRLLTPRMPMSGDHGADILVLGLAPSQIDDREGALWQGKTADPYLTNALPRRYHHRLAYQSMMRCGTGTEHRPFDSFKDVHACSIHLADDVANSNIKYVIGVGDMPLRYFAPGEQLHEVYGTKIPIQIGERLAWLYPVFDPYYIYTKKGWHDDGPVAAVFRGDMKRFFKEFETWGEPEIFKPDPNEVLLPDNEEAIFNLVAGMEEGRGVDIETKHLKPMMYDARLLTASFSDGKTTVAWAIDHPEKQNSWGARLLIRLIKQFPWIAHNASFELMWFMYTAQQLGESPDFAPFDDTMAMGRLYHERSLLLDLGSLSRVHLGTNFKHVTQVDARNIMAYPLSEVLPYNGLDAQASALMARKLLPGILRKHERNYGRFLQSVHATAGMELMGLNTDQGAAARLRAEWEGHRSTATAGYKNIYEVKMFEKEHQREFNISAAEDVGNALVTYGKLDLPKTGKGKQYSTDEDLLRKLAPDNPLVKAVLGDREAAKMISTYISPIEDVPTLYKDGLLHPGYSTMLTATTRLSSMGPNIQNFPKRKHKELREQIIAPPGHMFYAFDFGQLEARVIAMATQDPELCRGIIGGRDIHTDWLNNCLDIYPDYLQRLAQETNHTEEKKIRKYGRDIIKTDFVFASFFGSTTKSVSERTRIPPHLVKQLHQDFWQEFAGVKKWIAARRAEYEETGSMHLLTDIVRHTINWGGNEPINTPIQGTAACVVVEAMNELAALSRELKDPYFHPRINIHDDLMFVLPEDFDHAQAYVDRIMETMVKVRFDWQIVPLMVEGKVGPSWADLEEFTTHTGEYVK